MLLQSATLDVPRGSLCPRSHCPAQPPQPLQPTQGHVQPCHSSVSPLATHPLLWQEGRMRRDKWQWLGMHKRYQACHLKGAVLAPAHGLGEVTSVLTPPARLWVAPAAVMESTASLGQTLDPQPYQTLPGWGDWRAVPAGTTLPP